MAIAKFAAPIAGLRGTIGGVTYSANKSGPYVKQWSRSANQRTYNQQVQRAYIAGLASEWRSLSTALKAEWSAFAALPAQELTNSLGEAYYASGFNWFVKCNTRLDRAGRAHITAVPTQARPAAPTLSSFLISYADPPVTVFLNGNPTASTLAPNLGPEKAFDDLYTDSHTWYTEAGQTTGWLQYTLPQTLALTKYSIWINLSLIALRPQDWTFQYFDGAAWQTVDTKTNPILYVDAWTDFSFANVVKAKQWRINVSANHGDPDHLAITELASFPSLLGPSKVTYPADEFVAATDYDLVLHIAMSPSTGTQVYFPNYFEILVDTAPGNTETSFQDELEAVFGSIQFNRAWYAKLFRQTQEGIRSAAATARTETV